MIKRTLYFGNPCRIGLKDNQLYIDFDDERSPRKVPIEDIGVVVLDDPRVVMTNALITSLMENNSAIVSCNTKHMPDSLMLRMHEHHAFTEKVRNQFTSSEPLRKNLWQQTVIAKIKNQGSLLRLLGIDADNMDYWASSVKSGDPDNYEARAAAYYWRQMYGEESGFKRTRFGEPPNNLLNYGYAILRAVVARSLVASGLMTFMGIHHKNKYNPYCLADDIMEPYRPLVDQLVLVIAEEESDLEELTPAIKAKLLTVPTLDVNIDGKRSPLMVAVQRTTASLTRCFEGGSRRLLYPDNN